MPTTPGQPGEKIYRTPQPPENHVSRGGFTQTRTPTAPPPAQERRSVDAASTPDLATGNADQRASGKIEEGVPSVTNGPGRIES